MPKKLYLMRHGETLFNTQKRVQGWCDSPLTEKGLAQAEQAGVWFRDQGIHFGAVYASTQERAADTAKIVSGQDQVSQVKGLKEMHFGSFEAQPEMLLPKFRPGARSFEDLLVPYGGESIAAVGQRVRQTVTAIAEESQADTLLLVSHGAALWGLVQELALAVPDTLRFGNCSICDYDWEAGDLRLVRVVDPIGQTEVRLD